MSDLDSRLRAPQSSGDRASQGGVQETPEKPSEERCRRCLDVFASAAHDLNTPIAVLAGYVELLQSSRLGPATEKQKSVFQEISENISRLQRFSQQFLTFHQGQVGVALEMHPNDLNQCIAEVVAMWAPQFDRKGVAHYFLPAASLPRFEFDYDKTQHVISNLIDNALKYTPTGGSVWVESEPYMWERRTNPGPYVGSERRKRQANAANVARTNVCDSGPGIAPEFHQEIFEQFRRINPSGVSGTGLGLTIARRLVEAHHGKIWVESDRNKGSKFCFVLPLRAEKKERK